MTKAVIGMILEHSFPPDIRVEKEAASLAKAGFEVHLLCLSNENAENYNLFKGFHIHRIQWGNNKLIRTISKIIDRVFLKNILWISAIKRFVKDHKITVLHVHDLPLVNNAIAVRQAEKHLKLVVDMHENWPAALQDWHSDNKWPLSMFHSWVHGYNRWLQYEKEALVASDQIIAVVDEMKQRMNDVHNIHKRKITVIPNFETSDFSGKTKQKKDKGDQFTLIYVGGIGQHRGIDVAIKGMVFLRNIPRINLIIVGSGPDEYVNKMKSLVDDLFLEDLVTFAGQQPFSKVSEYIESADIGLVPHKKTEHTDHTIPHKLFQYMLIGLPVIVSDCKPLKRYVTEANAGAVFHAGSPEDFARVVSEMYAETEKRKHMGECAIKAANGKFNWTVAATKLEDLYRSF